MPSSTVREVQELKEEIENLEKQKSRIEGNLQQLHKDVALSKDPQALRMRIHDLYKEIGSLIASYEQGLAKYNEYVNPILSGRQTYSE